MTDTTISPAPEVQNSSSSYPDLKALRETSGLSLQDIFESTRISVTYLKAIENGNFQLLPAPANTRLFMRSYARSIGVESEILIAAYEKYLQSLNPPSAQKKESDRSGVKSGGRGRMIPSLLSAVIAATIVIFLVYHNRPGRESFPTTPAPPVQTPPSLPPKVREATPGPVSDKKYHLVMAASEPVWIRILADGNRSEQMTLKAGETLERFASDSFMIDIGNAQGIAITFQGKSIDNIGKRGRVVHLRLPEE